MPHYPDEVEYSDKYMDTEYEYRHVTLTKKLYKLGGMNDNTLRVLNEKEWRSLGIAQSLGWEHYHVHKPEPFVLLFRRRLGTNPQTGVVDPQAAAALKAEPPPLGCFH